MIKIITSKGLRTKVGDKRFKKIKFIDLLCHYCEKESEMIISISAEDTSIRLCDMCLTKAFTLMVLHKD